MVSKLLGQPRTRSGRLGNPLIQKALPLGCAVLIFYFTYLEFHEFVSESFQAKSILERTKSALKGDFTANLTPYSHLLPEEAAFPSSKPNYTLGFLRGLCKHGEYPNVPSCFYSPRDLWPNTPEFAPYKKNEKSCAEGESDKDCLLHWDDFLNDEFNGASWCPTNFSTNMALPTPCTWHHHVALTSFAQCMLTKWNVTFFLDTGGLIGSLRNGGFEVTDHDVDFAAWIPDDPSMERLRKMQKDAAAMVEEASVDVTRNISVVIVLNARLHVNFLSRVNGEFIGHVDVWRFNVTPGNSSNVRTPAWPKASGMDKSNLFPLGRCSFMGRVVPCPRRPYPFLKQWFHLKESDLFASPRTRAYPPEASRASSNRSMDCLEGGGFPTLRKGASTKSFYASNDPRGVPPLSD